VIVFFSVKEYHLVIAILEELELLGHEDIALVDPRKDKKTIALMLNAVAINLVALWRYASAPALRTDRSPPSSSSPWRPPKWRSPGAGHLSSIAYARPSFRMSSI
jgi:hypothetical protein